MNPIVQSASSPQAEKSISLFLADHYSGIIATADMAANPHAAVVYYLPEPDFTLFFATKEETQKYKNIEENKQAAFVIYDEKTQATLQMSGRIRIVTEHEKKRETIKNMRNSSLALSSQSLPPAYKLSAGEYAVLQFIPRAIKLAVYSRSEKDEDLCETLLFDN